MGNETAVLVGVAVLAGILLMVAIKKQAEWLMDFVLRAVTGTLAVYLINRWFLSVGIVSHVVLGPVTVLTVAILGFPGVAALYGIGFYNIL